MRVYIRGTLQLRYYALLMLKGLAMGFGFVSVGVIVFQTPENYVLAFIPFLASLVWYELVHRRVRKIEREYKLLARGREARFERMQAFYEDKAKKYESLTVQKGIPLVQYHQYAKDLQKLCASIDKKHNQNLSKEFKARFAFHEKKECEENKPYVKT